MGDDGDEWFETYDNPMVDVVQAVRRLVLDADDRIDECITWKSHVDAKILGEHPVLEGGGDTARSITFASLDGVEAWADDRRAVLPAWIAWKR